MMMRSGSTRRSIRTSSHIRGESSNDRLQAFEDFLDRLQNSFCSRVTLCKALKYTLLQKRF